MIDLKHQDLLLVLHLLEFYTFLLEDVETPHVGANVAVEKLGLW